jgi:hypothetical protein
MIAYSKVINGITKYIDDEIVNKLVGLQKWAVGTAAGIMLTKGTEIFNGLKTSPLIKSMGIINGNDEIDVELIYKELKKQAQKGAVTFDIPLLGALTLNEQDVDKLYNKIIGG